jgi:hypothetical protein
MFCSMGGNLPIRCYISLSRDMFFIQVKQNKISWDKFFQILANFEIISQQIRD